MASIIKTNHLVIPGIAIGVLLVGRLLSCGQMDWYSTLHVPFLTPSGSTIATIWQIIFVLVTIVALYVWNSFPRNAIFYALVALLALNAGLNVAWSYLFFHEHAIGYAFLDAAALLGTTVALIMLIKTTSRTLSYLLVPYAFWLLYALVLNGLIWLMN